jgi:hypothetical protein
MTIIYYITLSVYRINQTYSNLALFITFATINAVYVSIWDLLMDWSLLQPNASKKWLRDVRGYKSPSYYYIAMVLDVLLRFNWVFYAVYTHDVQHSSICSFMVAFSECTRRGIWVLFRVENEHCSNVRRFKASRDVPLPYHVASDSEESSPQGIPTQNTYPPTLSSTMSHRQSTALEAQEAPSLRQRQQARTLTQIVADAHKQDFEKKRKPGNADNDNLNTVEDESMEAEMAGISSDEEDGEDDELDTQDVLDVEDLLRERRGGEGGGYFEQQQ